MADQYISPDEEALGRAHTKEETDAPCPMCGGHMAFDPEKGSLLCLYCDHTIALEGEDGPLEEQDLRQAEFREDFSWGESQKQVICNSCGAQTIYDALEISGTCPYCGSHQVMEEAVDTSLPPNGICPFAISRERADEQFKKWIKKRIFAPSAAKKSAKADSFTGIYTPFWTFDADTISVYSAQYGIRRTVTNSKGQTRSVYYWYRTKGTFAKFIDDELVLASSRHDRRVVAALEPFDLSEGKSYRPEYLAGFISERYSIGLEEGWKRGKAQMDEVLKNEITREIKSRHRADAVRSLKIRTEYSNITYKYLLLPIWMSSFFYRQKTYRFMVNGQTGKVKGKTPVSPWRVAVAVLLGLLLLLGFYLLAGEGSSDVSLHMAEISQICLDACVSRLPLPDKGNTISSVVLWFGPIRAGPIPILEASGQI